MQCCVLFCAFSILSMIKNTQPMILLMDGVFFPSKKGLKKSIAQLSWIYWVGLFLQSYYKAAKVKQCLSNNWCGIVGWGGTLWCMEATVARRACTMRIELTSSMWLSWKSWHASLWMDGLLAGNVIRKWFLCLSIGVSVYVCLDVVVYWYRWVGPTFIWWGDHLTGSCCIEYYHVKMSIRKGWENGFEI